MMLQSLLTVPAAPQPALPSPGCILAPTSPTCAESVKDTVDTAKGAVSGVKNTIDFIQDPLGYIAGGMQEAASGLTNDLLPALAKATNPDFSAQWWLEAYTVAFAVGIALVLLLLLRTLWQLASNRIGPEEAWESFFQFTWMYLVGASFGPAAGAAVVSLFNALTTGLIRWGLGDGLAQMQDAVKALDAVIRAGSPTALPGGSPIAIGIYFFVLLGLLVVLCVMIVSLVLLYMAGAVFPTAAAWLTNPETRDQAHKAVRLIVSLLAAKPLVFFMLGVALRMVTSNVFQFGGKPGVQALVGLAASAVAMLLAGFSPWIFSKMAPGVLPDGGGSGLGMRPQRGGPRRSAGAGRSTTDNGQMAQAAMASTGPAGALTAPGTASGGASRASGAAGAGAGGAGGGSAAALGGPAGMAAGGAAQAGQQVKKAGASASESAQDLASSSGSGAHDRPGQEQQQPETGGQSRSQRRASTPNTAKTGGATPGGVGTGGVGVGSAAGAGAGGAGPRAGSGADGAGAGAQSGRGAMRERLAAMGAGAPAAVATGVRAARSVGASAGALAATIEQHVDTHSRHQHGGGVRR